MVTIEVDGQELQVEQGSMIIEATDRAGIHVPRFCYHEKLPIAANCRMCLVHVEKAPKPLPACATPVTDGMKVYTKSQVALDAQRSVMEFLLINHPLDCPICDQGGECELQDVAMGYGKGVSRYSEGKRVVKDKDIGPLISTDMTRCIHCTRCVRFGEVVAGIRELGAPGRGEWTEIGTFIEKSVDSEVSGNVIDLCPVGALTNKPYRFSARAWELRQRPTIAFHDCLGSNLYFHTQRGDIKRAVPKDNEQVNEVWLSDRDRYSHFSVDHDDRILKPLIRDESGNRRGGDWAEALSKVSAGFKGLLEESGPTAVGALLSSAATLEEAFLFQKLWRKMGVHDLDARIAQQDYRDEQDFTTYPGAESPVAELDDANCVVIIGSNIRKELPLAALRIRKTCLHDGFAVAINPVSFEMNFPLAAEFTPKRGELVEAVVAFAYALREVGVALDIPASLKPNQQYLKSLIPLAEKVKSGDRPRFLLGEFVFNHPQASAIRGIISQIAKALDGAIINLTPGPNTAGVWMAGAVSHRLPGGKSVSVPGKNAREILEANKRGLFLFGFEPDLDPVAQSAMLEAMRRAEFVVSCSTFISPALMAHVDVVLPLASPAETAGTFVNFEGRMQGFAPAIDPLLESKPGWKILRVLGNFLEISGFDYESLDDVFSEFEDACPNMPRGRYEGGWPSKISENVDRLIAVTGKAIYHGDAFVRRSLPLQHTQDAQLARTIQINVTDADRLGLANAKAVTIDGGESVFPLRISERVPEGVVWLCSGAVAQALPHPYEVINLKRSDALS